LADTLNTQKNQRNMKVHVILWKS